MREKRTVYLAYGSNLNLLQMAHRCPNAKPWGAMPLQDWKLEFWGRGGSAFATIVPSEGDCVPVGVWSITARDERALDVYEGYPKLYRKEYLPLKWGGRYIRVMVYIMNHGEVNVPSERYFDTILDGYTDFGIDPDALYQALSEALEK